MSLVSHGTAGPDQNQRISRGSTPKKKKSGKEKNNTGGVGTNTQRTNQVEEENLREVCCRKKNSKRIREKACTAISEA